MNDIVLNKKVSIERCVSQIRDYYGRKSDVVFAEDFIKQDAIALNLQRICEMAIDAANHVIKTKKLGLPQDSVESFYLLHRAGLINQTMMAQMKGMVGFRNVLVHEYKEMDLQIMADIIENHLCEPLEFVNLVLKIVP